MCICMQSNLGKIEDFLTKVYLFFSNFFFIIILFIIIPREGRWREADTKNHNHRKLTTLAD